MAESIARYYVAEKNPEGGALPGVPLADITEERWSTLPEWLQNSVDALDCYRKTKPRTAHDPLPPVSNTERTTPGTGRKMTAIEAPADGSLSPELSGDDEAEKES